MARTGAGTRRPGAKTAGSGAKAATEGTKPAEGLQPQEGLQPPEGTGQPSRAPAPQDSAPAPEDDTPARNVAPAAPEGVTPSAGEAPEKAMDGEKLDTATEAPAAAPTTPDTAPPDTAAAEPPVASMTMPTEPASLASAPADKPATAARRGGFVPLVLGGVVAAAIGAGAALALFPQGWQPADTGALEARLIALEAREAPDAALAPLEERIAAVESSVPDLQPLADRLAALEASDDTDTGALLAPLEDRLARLESDLTTRIEAGIADALEGARDRQEAQEQAIVSAEQDLAAEREALEARTALAQLTAAAETGQPAADALPPLAAVTDLPPALNAFHQGLPQLRDLQASFPAAARDALAAAPLDEGRSAGDRVLNFLRSQTGARSLAPREGGDTDAILSRAEAHIRAADLPATLTELDALPEGPAAAMAEWRAQAEARVAALAALDEVQSRLNNQ